MIKARLKQTELFKIIVLVQINQIKNWIEFHENRDEQEQ